MERTQSAVLEGLARHLCCLLCLSLSLNLWSSRWPLCAEALHRNPLWIASGPIETCRFSSWSSLSTLVGLLGLWTSAVVRSGCVVWCAYWPWSSIFRSGGGLCGRMVGSSSTPRRCGYITGTLLRRLGGMATLWSLVGYVSALRHRSGHHDHQSVQFPSFSEASGDERTCGLISSSRWASSSRLG